MWVRVPPPLLNVKYFFDILLLLYPNVLNEMEEPGSNIMYIKRCSCGLEFWTTPEINNQYCSTCLGHDHAVKRRF